MGAKHCFFSKTNLVFKLPVLITSASVSPGPVPILVPAGP